MSNYEKVKNTITQIENILKKIKSQNMTQKQLEDYFFDNHSDIMNNYPFLVSILVKQSKEDRKTLDYMLENLKLIESGVKNEHEADVDIGQKIVDTYTKKK